MSALQRPTTFQGSYERFETYPSNLVYQTSYFGALQTYIARLNSAEARLFVRDGAKIFIPFRDLGSSGQALRQEDVLSDEALKAWLEHQTTIELPTSSHLGNLAMKDDPKCRFIFLSTGLNGHSRKPLAITRNMLTRILSYHQVMPSYLDFMSVFGRQSDARDLRFSGFREQTLLNGSPRAASTHTLGRSGQQFQLCYNLKSVACPAGSSSIPNKENWPPIRQAAFHHQFDVVNGNSLWIITKGDLELKSRVESMTGADGRPEDKDFDTPQKSFKSSLAAHLLYCHWATEEWRWYVQWLEEVIQRETNPAVYGDRNPNEARKMYRPLDLQNVQQYEEKTNEAIMILEANVEVITSLRNFYERLVKNGGFPLKSECVEEVLAFTIRLDEMLYDLKMHIKRASLLTRITADRKNLVSQHLQSQATEKMEDLTKSMGKIGSDSQKEAIAMKIITVVTLIFLPATFVSTFFSTDVVKYQNPNGASSGTGVVEDTGSYNSFSQLALNRWLEITIPLTALTLLASWLVFRMTAKRWEKRRHLFDDEEAKIG